jgi:hypothetical protein
MSLIKSVRDAIGAHVVTYHSQDDAAEIADAVFAAIDAAGWQLVPKEPTKEMLRTLHYSDALIETYRAMLSAAPKPE